MHFNAASVHFYLLFMNKHKGLHLFWMHICTHTKSINPFVSLIRGMLSMNSYFVFARFILLSTLHFDTSADKIQNWVSKLSKVLLVHTRNIQVITKRFLRHVNKKITFAIYISTNEVHIWHSRMITSGNYFKLVLKN